MKNTSQVTSSQRNNLLRRMAAKFVDTAIVMSISLLLFTAFIIPNQTRDADGIITNSQSMMVWFWLGVILFQAVIAIVFLTWLRATPGKALFRLRVEASDGTPLNFARAFGRGVLETVALYLGVVISVVVLVIGHVMGSLFLELSSFFLAVPLAMITVLVFFFMTLKNENLQAPYDRICGTRVVRKSIPSP